MSIEALVAIVAAYLFGSVSFAVLVSRMMGLPDPRTYGSNNPGATNVLRTGRKLAAALTLAGDCAKGFLAVWVAELVFGTAVPPAYRMAPVAVAVVVGHMAPAFHRFQGGKGVATTLGAMLGLSLWLGLGALSTWIIMVAFFRYSSLAAIIAAASSPAWAYLLFGLHPYTLAVAIIAVLLVWRHKGNIRKLLDGTEPRIGAKHG